MPPSLRTAFRYEPSLLSEELVRLQCLIHNNHQNIERWIDHTAHALFLVERKAAALSRWAHDDAPRLVLPTLQASACAAAAYLANRPRPFPVRLAAAAAVTLAASFFVYPRWRSAAQQSICQHVIRPAPPAVHRLLDSGGRAYQRVLWAMVAVWDRADFSAQSARAALRGGQQRILTVFRPRPRD